MLEFLQKLIQSAGIDEARKTIADIPSHGIVALPNHFTERDLERYLPERSRLRGTMNTHIAGDFGKYVATAIETGAKIFVDETTMSATAVLNLGTPEHPGHADNLAVLTCKKTAAYAVLRKIADGSPRTQTDVAEFLEDWAHSIQCDKGIDTANIPVTHAIAAVRAITIEGLARARHEDQSLSANKTTFESIEAKSEQPIPTFIDFSCHPYVGFDDRTFTMRLGILTEGKPRLTLRIVRQEEHDEEMGDELANKLRGVIGDAIPVLLGKYQAKQ